MIDYTIRSNRLGFDRNYAYMLVFSDYHALTDSIYVFLQCTQHQHTFSVEKARLTMFCNEEDQKCLYTYVQDEYGHTPTTTPLISPTPVTTPSGARRIGTTRFPGTGPGVVYTPGTW